MISKDVTGYWATGITVRYDTHNRGWVATADYHDDGFVGDDNPDEGRVSTEGRLTTRYAVRDGDTVSGLSAAVDAIVADAAQLGIRFWNPTDGVPGLWYDGDGENRNYVPPEGWRDLLTTEAARIGWVR